MYLCIYLFIYLSGFRLGDVEQSVAAVEVSFVYTVCLKGI
jgi:hypothetical protein